MANRNIYADMEKAGDVNVGPVFGLDQYLTKFPVDYSPGFKKEVIETTDTHIIYKDSYGVTNKNDIHITSLPMEIAHPVSNWDTWNRYKIHYGKDTIEKRLPPGWERSCCQAKGKGLSNKAGRHQWRIPGFPQGHNGTYPLYDGTL